ncbi:MAG: hypothetical protein EKK37_12640 [Sphingobacteriales bacterium]|nr:MAG: hypothetical protein EKK37_12640 [Sphingobacteriales bacterium]
MTAKLFARTAAIFVFIHLIGHSLGHFGWDKPKDPKIAEVVQSMKSNKSEFMGATKSMADYFSGYSLIIFGLFFMTIILLWLLSNHANDNPVLVRQLLYPIGLGYLYFAIIELLDFFPFAASISFLAAVFTLLAAIKLRVKKDA